MPSHSLRFAGATPTEGTKAVSDLGHKGSARPRVQLRPTKPERWADFCSGFFGNGGGFLGGKLPKHGQKN